MGAGAKVAVITGAGTGIGRATALRLAGRGFAVALCGRRPAPLLAVRRLVEEQGGRALALPTDVRERAQVEAMVDQVLGSLGRLDVLVNNAGVARALPVLETGEDLWDDQIATNLKGVYLCCRSAVAVMAKARGGVIVNISSVLGRTGVANHAAYCASKFGVIGLTQALAEEVAPHGIRVYAVCPGATDTDLHRGIVGDELARLGMPPQTVAETIVGVVTGETVLPTGASLVIDQSVDLVGPAGRMKRLRQRVRGWLAAHRPRGGC
jgi:NAD(P)-dependent dehydrogenase (short-subunit alcohol dehydrogenase family)